MSDEKTRRVFGIDWFFGFIIALAILIPIVSIVSYPPLPDELPGGQLVQSQKIVTVAEKRSEPADSWTEPMMLGGSKMILLWYYHPDLFVLVLQAEIDGEVLKETVYVSENTYTNISIGDIYVPCPDDSYSKPRLLGHAPDPNPQ